MILHDKYPLTAVFFLVTALANVCRASAAEAAPPSTLSLSQRAHGKDPHSSALPQFTRFPSSVGIHDLQIVFQRSGCTSTFCTVPGGNSPAALAPATITKNSISDTSLFQPSVADIAKWPQAVEDTKNVSNNLISSFSRKHADALDRRLDEICDNEGEFRICLDCSGNRCSCTIFADGRRCRSCSICSGDELSFDCSNVICGSRSEMSCNTFVGSRCPSPTPPTPPARPPSPPPPTPSTVSNDKCEGAIPVQTENLPGALVIEGSTRNVFGGADHPVRCSESDEVKGIFFRFIGTGYVVLVTTCSIVDIGHESKTDFDTILSIFQGTCSDPLDGCWNDDDTGNDTCSSIAFDTEEDAEYNIHLHGYKGASGRFSLLLVFGDSKIGDTSPSPPTSLPTLSPSITGTLPPTLFPTLAPTPSPTFGPTGSPSTIPTLSPTSSPTMDPSTMSPTLDSTRSASSSPSTILTPPPTSTSSLRPSLIDNPTSTPTRPITNQPTAAKNHRTLEPSTSPIADLTLTPVESTSLTPSGSPTAIPSVTQLTSPDDNDNDPIDDDFTDDPIVNATARPTEAPTSSPRKNPDSLTEAPAPPAPTSLPLSTIGPKPETSGNHSANPQPTTMPTKAPTTVRPSEAPSSNPTTTPNTSTPTITSLGWKQISTPNPMQIFTMAPTQSPKPTNVPVENTEDRLPANPSSTTDSDSSVHPVSYVPLILAGSLLLSTWILCFS